MKTFFRLRERCFCAFCKAERKVYVKKHISLTNVVGTSLLAVTASIAYFGEPDPRALMLFCVLTIVAETFVYARWRVSVVCTLCGFDPIIYKRSPQAAAQRVRQFYDERMNDAKFQLTRSPLLKRQKQQRDNERKINDHKQILAKLQAKPANSLTPPKSL